MQFLLLIILAQALYSAGDLVRKFVSMVAFVIQLFVLKHYDLSRTITILACCAIVFSVALGIIFFKEKFSIINYAGVALAVVAVFLTHIGHDS